MDVARFVVWLFALFCGLSLVVVGLILLIKQPQVDDHRSEVEIRRGQLEAKVSAGSRGVVAIVLGLAVVAATGLTARSWRIDHPVRSTAPAEVDGQVNRTSTVETSVKTVAATPTPSTVTPSVVTPSAGTQPIHSGFSCDGRWLVSLGSVVKTSAVSPSEFAARLRAESGETRLVVLDTDSTCASLTPGIFMVVRSETYASETDGVAECRRLGRVTKQKCFSAPLTKNQSDQLVRRSVDDTTG